MSKNNLLLKFETDNAKLFEILVNGVPVYAAMRDGVNVVVNGGNFAFSDSTINRETGKISVKRIIDSIIKLKRFKKAKTLVFTSSVYRRDKGRNLAAEYLMDKYPEAVVFEWPSRNEGFDFAYFNDKLRDKYCPLEWYLIKYKLYMLFHKKEYKRYCDDCKEKLAKIFPEKNDKLPENYQKAIQYILSAMPNSYAVTVISQNIFRKIFKKYSNIAFAIDFWGSARENIIPVLPGKPQSVELQHGIITKIHPGYIYPKYVKNLNLDFFKRAMLVYGNKTKEILVNESIFYPEKIEVIGNPRIIKFKQKFEVNSKDRNLILFTSQPFEQDGVEKNYYSTVVRYLKAIEKILMSDYRLASFRLAVKLHPRESSQIADYYKTQIQRVTIYDNTSELFEILAKSYLHITVSSTTLFEAASFNVPTIIFNMPNTNAELIYGFRVLKLNDIEENTILSLLINANAYEDYMDYINSSIQQ